MSLLTEIEKFLLEEGYSAEEVAQLEMCECGEWVAQYPETTYLENGNKETHLVCNECWSPTIIEL